MLFSRLCYDDYFLLICYEYFTQSNLTCFLHKFVGSKNLVQYENAFLHYGIKLCIYCKRSGSFYVVHDTLTRDQEWMEVEEHKKVLFAMNGSYDVMMHLAQSYHFEEIFTD